MSIALNRGAHIWKCVFLALMVLFAQQAAQLHALSHGMDQLAQPHKGKPASHAFEQCIAFHAIDSALTAAAAMHDFDFLHAERASWFRTESNPLSSYSLPARAPPLAV